MRRATHRPLLAMLAATCVVACSGAAPSPIPDPVVTTSAAPAVQRVVVLDPGHNGGNYAGRADIR